MSEKTADELFDELGAQGEAGHAGHDPYAAGPHKPQPEKLTDTLLGGLGDAAKNFANTMTFGAAPVLEGAMGAVAKQAVEPGASPQALLDAYKAVRDEGAKEHAASAETGMGKLGGAAALAAPHPLLPSGLELGPKALPTAIRRGLGGVAVGSGVGAVSGAANSPADLTSDKPGQVVRLLYDTGTAALGGGLTGGVVGGTMAATESPVRRLAEAQALKAAGLEGGIKNASKAMGLNTEEEALSRGRDFLNEGLIPWKAALPGVSAKKAVADEAAKLKGMAGNSIGAQLNAGETSGVPFNHLEHAQAALEPYNNATAVARRGGQPVLNLADDLEAQGRMTPGSFVGANKAKSDAWDSANFNDEAPIAKRMYRQAVGKATGNIEDQLRRAAGPDAADALAEANRRYGIAADAEKLANESGTRTLNRNSLGLGEKLALAGGLGGSTAALTGHPGGAATGLGAALLANYAKKHGNALTARSADALAERLAESTGGHAGGLAGQSLANKLAPWEQFLHKDEEKKP